MCAAHVRKDDPLYQSPAPDRVHYATGTLLDAGDFRDEQTYHRSRLARALTFLAGGGTLAGLKARVTPAASGRPEQLRVEPGLAIDHLGRLIELPRAACLRLDRWYEQLLADETGADALRRAANDDIGDLLCARALGEFVADPATTPIPGRGVVADLFVRFVACERGLTPSFASGPFDALDAATASRVRDGYELALVPREEGLTKDLPRLPRDAWSELGGIVDPAQRRAALQDKILDAWPKTGVAGKKDALAPPPENPAAVDPAALFLARVVIPVGAGNPPPRANGPVLVDNWARRLVLPAGALGGWIGV